MIKNFLRFRGIRGVLLLTRMNKDKNNLKKSPDWSNYMPGGAAAEESCPTRISGSPGSIPKQTSGTS
jgi:hypothetical protein